MKTSDPAQVIIVGAGPAGLTVAALLAEAGVCATVLEAESELPTNLRASTFHPPTLQMLERFGVTDKLVSEGLIAPTFQFRDRFVGKLAEFDFDCKLFPQSEKTLQHSRSFLTR